MFDINNLLIDRVLRGLMIDINDGSLMWSINQITDPSLSVTTETEDAVDAMGSPINTFYRAKAAELSGSNSIIDLSLYAAQQGTERAIATSTAKIVAPAFETLQATTGAITLKHAPKETPKEIYVLKGDGTLGSKLEYSSTAGAGKFTYDDSAHTVTLPEGATGEYFIVYEYETEEATAVTVNATDFPKAGKFIMDVLCTDVCDTSTLIHAYVIMPNAKLTSDVDLNFTTDGTHPFTIRAQQAYCDSKKLLFQIVVPDEE